MPRKTSPNSAVLKKSVTKQDYNATPYEGYGYIQLTLPFPNQTGVGDLPPYWSPLRDRVLKTTPMREAMWASAVGIATSRVAANDWHIEGRKIRYWHDLLNSADNNQSWVSFQEKQLRDFLLTDNGNHFELIRTTNARGARLIGIQHLPSWRVIRTGDPDIPVIYRDRRGTWHEMKDYQVVSMADEPDSDDIFFGTGHCAASRAWSAIIKLSALELYTYEKISGKRPSRIYLANANLNDKQLQAAIHAGEERSDQKGYAMYMDAIIIPILDPQATASVASIDLKGLPEGFKPEEERIHAMLTYADAIGMDPVELDPNLAARGRALGSGSQAQVLDDKQTGRGLASYYKKASHLYNEFILPGRVTFFFGSSDLADAHRKAQIMREQIAAVRDAVGKGTDLPILTPEQAKQILADLNVIPSTFLIEDLTDEELLNDDDKPSDLDIEHKPPRDESLMLTKPKPEPKPLSPNGSKPKVKESLNQHLAARAKDWEINQAEDWAADRLPGWMFLSESELLDIYRANTPPVARKEQKEKVPEPQVQVVKTETSNPTSQIVLVQPNAQPIHVHMPQELSVKEITFPPVNVAAPEVQVNQQPAQIIVNVPEGPPPTVTVNPPVVNVTNEPPVNNVNVSAPNVEVTNQVPETPAPTVNVNLPHNTTEVLDVVRDSEGLIERIVKKITNAD